MGQEPTRCVVDRAIDRHDPRTARRDSGVPGPASVVDVVEVLPATLHCIQVFGGVHEVVLRRDRRCHLHAEPVKSADLRDGRRIEQQYPGAVAILGGVILITSPSVAQERDTVVGVEDGLDLMVGRRTVEAPDTNDFATDWRFVAQTEPIATHENDAGNVEHGAYTWQDERRAGQGFEVEHRHRPERLRLPRRRKRLHVMQIDIRACDSIGG